MPAKTVNKKDACLAELLKTCTGAGIVLKFAGKNYSMRWG